MIHLLIKTIELCFLCAMQGSIKILIDYRDFHIIINEELEKSNEYCTNAASIISNACRIIDIEVFNVKFDLV